MTALWSCRSLMVVVVVVVVAISSVPLSKL
jgi:hypothetical protein